MIEETDFEQLNEQVNQFNLEWPAYVADLEIHRGGDWTIAITSGDELVANIYDSEIEFEEFIHDLDIAKHEGLELVA